MLDRHALFLALVVGCPPTLGACNALTGADGLSLDEPRDRHGDDSDDADDNAMTTGAGGMSVGQTTSGPVNGPPTTSATATTGTEMETLVDAAGVTITQIALYQGVKRPLMVNGAPESSNIPIVAGRDALVRVFTSVDGSFNGSPVTARLYIGENSAPIEKPMVGGNSSDGNLNSTTNFDVPGAALVSGATYRVELKQQNTAGPTENPAANYPASGFEGLDVSSAGSQLKIKLVPISYGADGSDRLPDTSASQLQRYKDLFYAIYPVPAVDITVRNPVGWDGGISANGNGWDSLLDAIMNLREDDNTPADVYYMGIFAPAQSFNNYCQGGCVSGLGSLGGPNDAFARAAIGLGFTGDEAAQTAVHEIGHNHGRQHAPCGGAQGVDPGFPYNGGIIGVWGYDLVNKDLFQPNQTADLMSYCDPMWVSDYTFKAFFNRIKAVNNAAMIFPPESQNLVYERVRIDTSGNAVWMTPIKLRIPPMGHQTPNVTLKRRGAKSTLVAQYFPYDHLDGGIVVWPKPAAGYDAAEIAVAGKIVVVTP